MWLQRRRPLASIVGAIAIWIAAGALADDARRLQVFTGDRIFLKVEPDGWLGSVTGDGSEAGVAVVLKDGAGSKEPLTVTIPELDNSASCSVQSVTASYVMIATQVQADTGSCLIWIRKPSGETAAVIAYAYVVD